MSIYDKASLVLIPSGTKTSKVYSQKPVNGDGDFTFSRSTAATRVNADGNIEKETQNLLLYSNTFSNANWVKGGTTITGSQAGYDGSNDASLLLSTTTGFPRVEQTISASGVLTFSVYLKEQNDSFALLRTYGANSQVWFDLTDGSVANVAGDDVVDSNIEDIGSGWYRASVTISGSITKLRIYPASAYGVYSTASNGIYIQDAQVEQGLVARDYIETTTAAVEGGITDNVPRLDYTDSSCPALLLEPQRTNLVEHSEYFNDWGIGNLSLNANAATSPEGLDNAYEVTFNLANHFLLYADIPVSSNTKYTFSFYVKRGTATDLKYRLRDASNSVDIIAPTSYYSQTSSSEWKRIEVTITTPSNCTSLTIYTFSDGQSLGTAYVYGAQLEAGSYATSYIPTYGTSVTRNGDVCGNAGNSTTFNSTEGVLYSEIKALDNTGGLRLMQLSDGTNSNRVSLYYDGSSAAIYANVVVNNNANPMSYGVTITDYVKVAIAWSENYFSLWVNGSEVDNDTNGNTFSVNTLNVLNLSLNGVYPFLGDVKQILTFNSKLSNEELAALTTI